MKPIHTYVQRLDMARFTERVGDQSHPTLTAQAVPEDILVAIELNRIINSVTIIHWAIARLQAENSPNR